MACDSAEQARWESRYRALATDTAVEPARVVSENRHLLPTGGRALELACGLGGNALLLAERGLEVVAWDLSPTAIERLSRRAQARGLRLSAEVRDIVAEPPPAGGFDVVVVSRFLERRLLPAIAATLRPGGLLFYQAYLRERVGEGGPSNPDYRLAPNELLHAFAALQVLVYREEGRCGDLAQGVRDEAQLVARRPL